MRLRPAPEVEEFAAGVQELFARSADSAALRAAWDSPDGRVPGLWASLAALGGLGLHVPAEYGGAGLDLPAVVRLLVAAGRSCLPEPLVETVVAAELLARAGTPAAAMWLPRLVAGTAVVGLSTGAGGLVSAGGWADLVLLVSGDAVHAVPADEAGLEPAESVDRGTRPMTATREPDPDTELPGVHADLARDLAAVAAAAELLGLADAMLDMAVRYAGTREQFGRAIGSFQAVKHQLADAYVANAFTGPVVARAAWSLAHRLPSAGRDASHAKLQASAAAARAGRTALQVHAGIGYTYEHDLHMWLKRSWTLRSLYGDDTWHRARAAAVVLGAAPARRVP